MNYSNRVTELFPSAYLKKIGLANEYVVMVKNDANQDVAMIGSGSDADRTWFSAAVEMGLNY